MIVWSPYDSTHSFCTNIRSWFMRWCTYQMREHSDYFVSLRGNLWKSNKITRLDCSENISCYSYETTIRNWDSEIQCKKMLLEVWLESPLQYVWNKLLCLHVLYEYRNSEAKSGNRLHGAWCGLCLLKFSILTVVNSLDIL
jgi:hypothetical protein